MLSTIPISFLKEVRDIEPVHAGCIIVSAEHFALPVDRIARDVAEAGTAEAMGGADVGSRW